jgi:glycosyltransferase involved in cell wall biosynthesis
MLLLAYLPSKIKKAILVYDSFEICTDKMGVLKDKKAIKYVIKSIEKYLVKRVNAMIVVSNSAADYFCREYGINPPYVVTNCPYTMNNSNSNSISNGFDVLYHGLFGRARGIEELILSAKHLKQGVRIILRGFGKCEKDFRRLISENNLEEKVIFAEPVKPLQVVSEAQKSHVGVVLTEPVCLNHELTVSNKIFEYLSAGLPVIMSNVSEHRLLNERYNFGVIIKNITAEDLGIVINRLREDNSLYSKLKENAINASKIFNWEKESEKLLQMYKGIL